MKPGRIQAGRSSRAWAALAGYAIVTFAWTWTFWWGGVIAGALSIDVPVALVVFLGGPGPLLGALFVLRRSASSYRRGFLGRIVDPRRVPGTWWLATAAVAVPRLPQRHQALHRVVIATRYFRGATNERIRSNASKILTISTSSFTTTSTRSQPRQRPRNERRGEKP
jgi:hypothetical protein